MRLSQPVGPPPTRYLRTGILLALFAGGCGQGDTPSTAPNDAPLRRAGPSFSAAPLTCGSMTVPLGNPNAPDGSVVLCTFPTEVVANVTFSGTVKVWRISVTPEIFLQEFDAAGYCPGTNSPAAGAVIGNDLGTHSPPQPCMSSPTSRQPASSQSNVGKSKGTLVAHRTGGVSCGSETPPCRRFEGDINVAVDPVAATLGLMANRYVFDGPNQTATMTAFATPSSAGPYGIPITGITWQFTPDGGGSPVTLNCSTTCNNWGPPSSGTVHVTATVNGVQQEASIHLHVLCGGLTGDSILDKYPVLDAIDSAWKLSNATASNQLDRREASWAVDCRPGGECIVWVDTTLADPTSTSDSVPLRGSPWVRVATGHTHPFIPCDRAGSTCFSPDNADTLIQALWQDTTPRTHYVRAGPSPEDFVSTSSDSGLAWRAGSIHYVADGLRIYRIEPGLAADTKRVKKKFTKQRNASCSLY